VRAGLAAAAGLAALAGLGLGLALRSGGGTSPEAIAALAARVDEEREARGRLEAQLARLEADLAALREGGSIGEGEVAPYPAAPGEAAEGPAASGGDEVPPEVEPSPGQAWFDPRRLAAAGLPERDAEELHRLYEDVELQRLYLQNQAQRERWPRDRLATELAALDERLLAVRDDYGEDAYDWFLYAAGRANRVVVEGVLGGSAAAEAGIRTGDAIVRYDGERIFKPPTLIRGTLAGRLNESVEVEIQRPDGTRTTVTLPRGPVGVRLGRRTVEPSALR
jgi:membrane-associated protease RseP (regulator of RpoE activity)